MLRRECGDSEISIENARFLIETNGKPYKVIMRTEKDYDIKTQDCFVEDIVVFRWITGYDFAFTGFAWGYIGDKPKALYQLLFDILHFRTDKIDISNMFAISTNLCQIEFNLGKDYD